MEDLRIVTAAQTNRITESQYKGIEVRGVVDGWLRRLEFVNTMNTVTLGGRRLTVEGVRVIHEAASDKGAGAPADFTFRGSQILAMRSGVRNDEGFVFFFAVHSAVSGPNVILDCDGQGLGAIQPHMRWATGFLVDNAQVPKGSIDFMNRGTMGSGHGWAVGWAVAWNCVASTYRAEQAPGSRNWFLGCRGARDPKANPETPATFESEGIPLKPRSLYLAQLKERLGRGALEAIGYGD